MRTKVHCRPAKRSSCSAASARSPATGAPVHEQEPRKRGGQRETGGPLHLAAFRAPWLRVDDLEQQILRALERRGDLERRERLPLRVVRPGRPRSWPRRDRCARRRGPPGSRRAPRGTRESRGRRRRSCSAKRPTCPCACASNGSSSPPPGTRRRSRRVARLLEQRGQLARRFDVGVIDLDQRLERLDGARGVAALDRDDRDERIRIRLAAGIGHQLRRALERLDRRQRVARFLQRLRQLHLHAEALGIRHRQRLQLVERRHRRNLRRLERRADARRSRASIFLSNDAWS